MLALAAPLVGAQTYTNENILSINAYSAFPGAPSASRYQPYVYASPPSSTAGCTGVGGTCVPVAIAGSPTAGYWFVRGGQPYWFKCV